MSNCPDIIFARARARRDEADEAIRERDSALADSARLRERVGELEWRLRHLADSAERLFNLIGGVRIADRRLDDAYSATFIDLRAETGCARAALTPSGESR